MEVSRKGSHAQDRPSFVPPRSAFWQVLVLFWFFFLIVLEWICFCFLCVGFVSFVCQCESWRKWENFSQNGFKEKSTSWLNRLISLLLLLFLWFLSSLRLRINLSFFIEKLKYLLFQSGILWVDVWKKLTYGDCCLVESSLL